MSVEFNARPQRSAARSGSAAATHWAVRAVLALILMLGMFGVSRTAPGTSRNEPVSEGHGKDAESTKESDVQAQAKRRNLFASGRPPAGTLTSSRVPRTLAPRGAEPPRPSWQRPRRSPPSGGDDDDDELG